MSRVIGWVVANAAQAALLFLAIGGDDWAYRAVVFLAWLGAGMSFFIAVFQPIAGYSAKKKGPSVPLDLEIGTNLALGAACAGAQFWGLCIAFVIQCFTAAAIYGEDEELS